MRVVIGLLLAVLLAPQALASEADEILAQLLKIRLDKKQIYNIRDITIRRDALSISLNRGTIAFLEPVLGKVTGAVFIGSGEIVTIPPDTVERRQIFKFTGSPVLNEPFRAAFFRFTDNTYEDILKAYRDHAYEEVTAGESAQFLPWETVVGERAGILNYRILADYLNPGGRPIFFAELNGERHGWFDAVYDPRLVEEVAILKSHSDDPGTAADIWASFHRRGEARDPQSVAHEMKAPLDILSYEIESTISTTTELQATATMRLKGLAEGERALSFDLSRFLRVASVTTADGRPVPFFQHGNMTAQEVRQYGVNAFIVVLPEGLRAGEESTLTFKYAGDVIERRGTGIFYVGDRGLWYPNLGHQDRAAFKLTFHYPAAYKLVATGNRLNEWDEAGLRHSVWTSDAEFAVAGFNLGDFTILADETGPIPIYVCVNNDVETIYKEVAARRAVQREQSIRAAAAATSRRGQAPASPAVSPDYSAFSTKDLGDNVLKEVRATLDYFVETFGPYPYKRLTVSQFPVDFSQGWPSLLYVSTLSFFASDQRQKLGLDSEPDFMLAEFVRAHEIAHQWFGNKVGWRSYRDQWISEGFANYAGVMYMERKYPARGRMGQILDTARLGLLEAGTDGKPKESAGPVWLGQRLASSIAPDGYTRTVYNKSTWVIHMLRMLMRGDGPNPDAAFLQMTRELLETFEGRLISTWDFKRIAEKHMAKSMDVRGDKKLDWFFDQWVFGNGVPAYTLGYNVSPSADGFVIEGVVKQAEVPDDAFVMPVPIYADGQRLGRVLAGDGDGAFRFTVKTRPAHVDLDPHGEVLWKEK